MGAIVEYFDVLDEAGTFMSVDTDAIFTYEIMGLGSFTNYNISLAVVNRLGPSSFISIIEKTLSPGEHFCP